MDKARAKQFLAKAEKYLRWCDHYLGEMRYHGQARQAESIDHVERIFVSFLALFDSAHDALGNAVRKLDDEKWCDHLDQLREQDPLLRYLWKARNSETHDALIKWQPGMRHVNVRVVDREKRDEIVGHVPSDKQSEALFYYLWGAKTLPELQEEMTKYPVPPVDLQEAAGVEILQSLESLTLNSFMTGGRNPEMVTAPSRHMGAALPPSADQAVYFGIQFLRGKLGELQARL